MAWRGAKRKISGAISVRASATITAIKARHVAAMASRGNGENVMKYHEIMAYRQTAKYLVMAAAS